ncbi:MAG: hypothetical protein KF861_19380, partial [Planctomycetaceae bacterium]|nr:hypothetical protein [Planctomycetaceae bacterium]
MSKPRVVTLVITLAIVLSGSGPVALAAGKEFSRQAEDLVLTVDGRWPGCGHGGYYPVRIKVVNRGLERDLTFQFRRAGNEAVPTVRRAIRVPQNATARLTLSIPCVGNGTYGTLNVYQNGRLIKQFTETLNLPDNRSYEYPRPALLIISPTNVDASSFETAVTSIHGATHGSSSYSYGYGYGYVSEDHLVVGPEMLPDAWIDYSGLDMVALSLKTLGGLPVEERSAILKWVHSGGTLLVMEAGAAATSSPDVSRLLDLPTGAAASSPWRPASVS